MKHVTPPEPAMPGHLRLSLPGALALFVAGALCAVTVMAALIDKPLFALSGALVTGALLVIVMLDAARPPEQGWYVRQPGGLLYRRNGGR